MEAALGRRRLPYLLYGTLIAVIVMILMPNSGSFGFGYASLAALSFGALMIALLDVSSNMAMQPFKMMVGDMVNEEQKSYAYGIQSFLANTGAVVAAVLPFVFAYIGLANTAEKGVVPQTVVVAFYVGAALLVITSAFTIFKVKEYDPETYARYHGIDVAANQEKANWFELLKTAPKAFWTVTLVQFFCWFAFQYMWTYSAGAIAENVWHTTDASSVGYQERATGTACWRRCSRLRRWPVRLYWRKFPTNTIRPVISVVSLWVRSAFSPYSSSATNTRWCCRTP